MLKKLRLIKEQNAKLCLLIYTSTGPNIETNKSVPISTKWFACDRDFNSNQEVFSIYLVMYLFCNGDKTHCGTY